MSTETEDGQDFEFVGLNQKVLEERKKIERTKSRSRSPVVWLTPKAGIEYIMRLMPPWTDSGPSAYLPYKLIFQHWDVGPEGKRIICPNKMSDGAEDCYVCEQMKALYDGDETDQKKARKLFPSRRFLYQILDKGDLFWTSEDEQTVDNPELLGKPKIKFVSLPYTAHQQLMNYLSDPDYGNATHPINGHDFKLRREGAGRDTEYIINARPVKSPMFGSSVSDVDIVNTKIALEGLINLDEHPFFRTASYEESKAVFYGEKFDRNDIDSPKEETKKLDVGKISEDLSSWIAAVEDGKVMNRAEVSEWYGCEPSDMLECYSDEPDHTSEDCWKCPVKAHCAKTYHSVDGKYSVSQTSAPSAEIDKMKSKLKAKK